MKKISSLMLVLALLMGLMAGCGTEAAPETTASAEQTEAAAPAEAPEQTGDSGAGGAWFRPQIPRWMLRRRLRNRGPLRRSTRSCPLRRAKSSPIFVSCRAICPCSMSTATTT